MNAFNCNAVITTEKLKKDELKLSIPKLRKYSKYVRKAYDTVRRATVRF